MAAAKLRQEVGTVYEERFVRLPWNSAGFPMKYLEKLADSDIEFFDNPAPEARDQLAGSSVDMRKAAVC
jgi:hypothetical protein